MIKKIIVLDRFGAAKLMPEKKTILMRIFSSDVFTNMTYPRLNYGEEFYRIFEYSFDDLTPFDIKELEEEGEDTRKLKLFSVGAAERIIRDFKGVYREAECFVCHCKEGRNRSPALAAGLNHAFGLEIPDEDYLDLSYHEPNMHVYRTILRVARERCGMKFKSSWPGE